MVVDGKGGTAAPSDCPEWTVEQGRSKTTSRTPRQCMYKVGLWQGVVVPRGNSEGKSKFRRYRACEELQQLPAIAISRGQKINKQVWKVGMAQRH